MVQRLLLYLWLFVLSTCSESSLDSNYNASHLLDSLLDNYDRRLRPGFGGPPTLVDVNLNIRSMGPIREKDMTYNMDCYFRQSWVDKRLAFSGSLGTLTVSVNLLTRMWKPDTHFYNGRASYLHTVTTPNKLLRINQDGRVLYSMRLTVQASCPMHLEKFPMDTQFCPLQFGSHGYSVRDVVYKWTHGRQNSIKMSPDMRLSQFDLIAFPAWTKNITLVKDAYSLLNVQFVLRRHTGYFLINVYVPLALLTVLSWVGFWINREATSDRIALGVMVVLTMVFLGIDNRADLPKVSYSTALDYYVGICFANVLASIIQFAAVHFFTKRGSGEYESPEDSDSEDEEEEQPLITTVIKAQQSNCRSNGHGIVHVMEEAPSIQDIRADNSAAATSSGNTGNCHRSSSRCAKFLHKISSCVQPFCYCIVGSASYRQQLRQEARANKHSRNSVSSLDRVSRVVFPVAFAVFNIFYWMSYSSPAREHLAYSGPPLHKR